MPFADIEKAVAAIGRGEIIIVVDDEDRENEGDLIMAAEFATPEAIAFFVRHTSGLICAPITAERADELDLPLMVATNTEGGVLKRAGHTEAAVDLARMAGLYPAGVLCELVSEDRLDMARLPELTKFAEEHGLLMISIADIIRYRRQNEKLVRRVAEARIPTDHGDFTCYAYEAILSGDQHIAFVKGAVQGEDDVLVRVHSECLTGDVFGSLRCDCGPQLDAALRRISEEGRGVVVYLRGHEGRGIGIAHKLRAYALQELGRDTVDANLDLGLPVDSREYGIGAQILVDLGITTMRYMTNNPAKYGGLDGFGLEIVERVPLNTVPNPENIDYLRTKRDRMGHLLEGLDDLI